jgi:GNAT superfamily N-acetyltransferase
MDQTEKWELPGGLSVMLARAADADAVLTLLTEADEWMRRRGIEPGVPPVPLRDIISERIASAKCYVARQGGPAAEIVGAITLEWMDDGVWRDRHPADDAGYVHGLVSRRARAGQGIGLSLLRWASDRARAAGKQYLRLDCDGNNKALRAYYTEGAGLAYRGDVSTPTHFASRFEKRLEGSVVSGIVKITG